MEATPIFQSTVILAVKAQGIYDFVKLCLEFIYLQVSLVVIPGGEKLFSGASHITAQMTNASGLRHDLLRLSKGI